MAGSREWDANTYDRVSRPQLEWGAEMVAELELRGGERVLDAGCGSGRVSELLLERLDPERGGRLIGVDGSAAMIAAARGRLGERAELIHSDLLALELAEPVDIVFSTATFHWIADHDALFRRIFAWLRPGGRLIAQCGGEGNIAAFLEIADGVAAREPYAADLAPQPPTRFFAGVEETTGRLQAAGFVDADCRLSPRRAHLDEPLAFLRSVCLGAHTAALPEELREPFVTDVYEIWGRDPVLDYVRLDIDARRPLASN
jgi:trans-aconitate 2-methyltransferase